MIYTGEYNSPVGRLEIRAEDGFITNIFPREGTAHEESSPVTDSACRWLEIYFSGRAPDFTPPLKPHGSKFSRLIWAMLLEIPFGETVTYSELAKKAAKAMGKEKMSPQAAGGAVGRNPIAIIIPCHRVIGADGSLTGYEYGLKMKEMLLKNEGISSYKHTR